MFFLFRGTRSRSVKVLAYPGMLTFKDSVQRIDDHVPINDDAHPAASPKQRIQIVRHHDHREPEL
jgi:hypothetical protein